MSVNSTLTKLILFILLMTSGSSLSYSQNCAGLTATITTKESRCMATGSITIQPAGGSGNYNYQVTGTSTNILTSASTVTGLAAGTYSVLVKDIEYGCSVSYNNVVIAGSYTEPRFNLVKTDLTCINSNNGTIAVTDLSGGRNPFVYTIMSPSPSQVGVSNTTGSFSNLVAGEYVIQMKDSCGGIQTRRISILGYDWNIDSYSVSAFGCDSASANITVKDNRGNFNTSSSIFNAFTYGYVRGVNDTVWSNSNSFRFKMGNKRTFTIVVKDGCGNRKTFNWTNSRIPSVASSVSSSAISCNTFTASITGQTNLQNPVYCLFNSSNVQVTCNSTGVFTGLAFGTYSIRITDNCYDTTIVRNITVSQPKPSVSSSVSISNRQCNSFSASVTGQSNLSSPVYRLFDSNGNQVSSNTNGVFNNLNYGSYCIRVVNGSCYDTTIIRCFNVARLQVSMGTAPTITSRRCNDASISFAGSNVQDGEYELFDSNNQLVAKNTTGTFSNLAYGNYCIKLTDDCIDTVVNRCFTLARLIPTVSTTVNQTNKTCSTFTASITGQSNLTNPVYSLYDSNNTLVSTNTNGTFNNLAYGSYCIRTQDPCYDTVISRCFSAAPNPVSMSLSAQQSCTIGTTDITANISGGTVPYIIKVYQPSGALVRTISSNVSSNKMSGLPALGASQRYTVVAEDACGIKSTQLITPVVGVVNKNVTTISKCPTAQWQNGASELSIVANSNLGSVTPVIISKNGTSTTINYSVLTAGVYRFVDLEPANYIIQYNIQNCTGKVYDTVTVSPYAYPNLQQSNAFQCDNNNFSLGAAVTGGSAPFMYEIIDSYPSSPSLQTAPQSNPVFNITNGVKYDLIRLRAVDACGNAALNDVSILPLANIIVTASSNCFYNDIRLSVDSIPNASYIWYRKTSATDSSIVGTGIDYRITNLLPSDTGTYVCKTSVNSGCLTKISSYTLTGMCGATLNSDGRVSYTRPATVAAQGINVYPNPVKEVINIKIQERTRQSYRISLYTVSGQMVNEQVFMNQCEGVIRMNRTSQMKKGVYILKIQNIYKGQVYNQRLVLE